MTVTSTPSTAPSADASSDASVVATRGSGVTLKAGDNDGTDLKGGRYRVAWIAEGCTSFDIECAPASGDVTCLDPALPSGETFVDLPAGKGFLNRVADCEYTVRFETTT